MSYAEVETFVETLPEFLAWEERQEGRFEFIAGKILATGDNPLRHNVIVGNLCHTFRPVLRKPRCKVFAEGVKLTIGNDSFYPDVLVNCSAVSMQDRYVTDAVLIAEVLSQSTEHDRGAKLHRYMRLPGLQHYLIVLQEKQIIEHYARGQDRRWQFELAGSPESLIFPTLGVEIPVAAIYEGAEVPA